MAEKGKYKMLYTSDTGKHKATFIKYNNKVFKIGANYNAAQTPEFWVSIINEHGSNVVAEQYDFGCDIKEFGTYKTVVDENNFEPYKKFLELALNWIEAVFTDKAPDKESK